ncbi:MAG: DUF4156 domain-containing protein [Agarilytica sp.]
MQDYLSYRGLSRKIVVLAAVSVTLGACQWVKPTQDAKEVSLVKPAYAQNCTKIGGTVSKVKAKVAFVKRKEKKVTDELITLAKNAAARKGGDTIIANGPRAEDGSQEFDIYRCFN